MNVLNAAEWYAFKLLLYYVHFTLTNKKTTHGRKTSTCPKSTWQGVGAEGAGELREARSLKRSGWRKQARQPGFHAGTRPTTLVWGVRSLLELGRWRSGLPTPTPLSFLHKKKCRAVVWHPWRLDTAPADGVSLAGSGVRACISEPVPEMWRTTHAGAPRAEDEAAEGPPRPGDHHLHTPRSGTEVG